MYLKWMKTKVANVLMHAQASWSEIFPMETLHPDELNQLFGKSWNYYISISQLIYRDCMYSRKDATPMV